MEQPEHVPVLLEESMTYLKPLPGGNFIDATVGLGGHAREILRLTSPSGQLVGIDLDENAISRARVALAGFGSRVHLVQAPFSDLASIARQRDIDSVDGIFFDLGVSSLQIDTPERGFSFQSDAPLDMRMGAQVGATAAELIRSRSQEELATIFHEYGEERFSRRIARRIVAVRDRTPIRTTRDLATLVAGVIPGHSRIHPATRIFQALRIAVNDELTRLEHTLPIATSLLKSGGRIVVISFHSLEDRIVKRFLQREARACICPPGFPVCTCGHTPTLRTLTNKPVMPTKDEVVRNARSRSAKLRAAERIGDPSASRQPG